MLDADAAAAFTGLAVATLAKLRCLGGGPAYIKLGRRVLYRRADLSEWLSARRVANTTEAALSLPRRLTDAFQA
jgi:predicted DNA-binding transcriptional regulator AlpA